MSRENKTFDDNLSTYISSFFKKEDTNPHSQFFTQYTVDEYYQKLPHLTEVELFCLRVFKALLKQEKVCIYADFDTDAVTATYAMYQGLIDQGFNSHNIQFYTPDRFKEGYGVNFSAIKKLAHIYDLIITVDCGINSLTEAEYVTTQTECDIIITDHHLSCGKRPHAIAVCNPQMEQFSILPEYQSTLQSILTTLVTELKADSRYSKHITKYYERTQKYISNPGSCNAMSQSVTGVGVAWFCVLWFAYFLEEIKYQNHM